MSASHDSGRHGGRCTCGKWQRLNRAGRERVLYEFMQWAWEFHRVELALGRRGPGVSVSQLRSFQPGHGKARTVMTVLGDWANCAGVRLELTPTDQWGADLPRLTRFFVSLGFLGDIDTEPWLGFDRPRLLVRYPASPAVGRARVVAAEASINATVSEGR